jgi:hypothetical protein
MLVVVNPKEIQRLLPFTLRPTPGNKHQHRKNAQPITTRRRRHIAIGIWNAMHAARKPMPRKITAPHQKIMRAKAQDFGLAMAIDDEYHHTGRSSKQQQDTQKI